MQRLSRRQLLTSTTFGVGTVALAHLLEREKLLASPTKPPLQIHRFDLTPKAPPLRPRATAMISMFMQGGPSQIDMFDPKPELTRRSGQPYPGEVKWDNPAQASSKMLGSPWKFSRHGKCGMEISELLPHMGQIADEITLIRSMQTLASNHGPGIAAMNTGRTVMHGNPALGSWMSYGLGSENQNLPAFVVLVDDTLPVLGASNWSSAWLPSLYQGTVIRPKEPRILNLDPPAKFSGAVQGKYLDFLGQLNRDHLQRHGGDLDLEARIVTYELAARMQSAAKEALDISAEPQSVREMYGIDKPESRSFGERCLIARRLVERGVRFVQIYTPTQVWDTHGHLTTSLPAACKRVDQPAAALVQDLKLRGLLDTTLVHWGGEMGRLPVIQLDPNVTEDKAGRDHNQFGFSMWLAGGGIKGGVIHGETDEFGHHAIRDIVNHHDYHATLLHLFGLDPATLAYRHGGREQTLLDGQPGRVVTEILA